MKNFDEYLKETGEFGWVQAIINPLFYVSGLPTAKPQEIILTENGSRGIATVLLPDFVEVLMLDKGNLSHEEKVARTNTVIGMDISPLILGRVVDPFGMPVDNLGPLAGERVYLPLDKPPPGVLERAKISQPFETGVMVVDSMVQIGKGQKELVLGDQKTGKTQFLLQTMAHQAKKGTICIYVSIGKKQADLKHVEQYLKESGALKNSVVIAATSSDPVSYVYFAPFAGFTIAEYFRDTGRDVLIVLDDMSAHAKYYREISLIAKKVPGRNSYPGDVFHHQARVLERSGLIRGKGGKKDYSITALPVVETQEGDITGYIQTNLMATTDGHLFFDMQEAKRGRYPPVNHTLSVTRAGNQTQTVLEKEIRHHFVLSLNEYYRIKETVSFGVEILPEYKNFIVYGQKIEAVLNQGKRDIVSTSLRYLLCGLLYFGFFKESTIPQTIQAKEALTKALAEGRLKSIEAEILKAPNLVNLVAVINKYKQKIWEAAYGNLQQKPA
ncbi:hypothetical protein A3F02_03210 [Candidatus Curtissbacteria bacterium RIFCSPHIGHO2_12_FULL_38_9b]|uniref:ATPase F1/V1/A1 complex alpha/beta subunit nucleotide-binding domain-containing protein n=1 Tax=Candidatus Curtissbacteria bacterium RIFCSPHIGHO2_12_FULL_38_9b TaxID=1797720 RepID=A0A1F5GW75_9BACT|nr:MAG: hypothetical protein A3F02_03210 [Candidatus Curtissbacteria bacterium RIFCSPHIGHO2_12_FULL_38_9b]